MDTPTAETKILKIEAQEVIKEVAFAVTRVEQSQTLQNTDDCIYMNIETKETDHYCVELSLQGFRIVGRKFDEIDQTETSQYYETIYALLDKVSPEYRNSFGEALMSKLEKLEDTQDGKTLEFKLFPVLQMTYLKP